MIVENRKLRDRHCVFSSRNSAGRQLIPFMTDLKIDLILAIPNGGVPVAEPLVAEWRYIDFNFLLIRKIQIPWNTEAGFGAVTPDGQLFFNEKLLDSLNLEETAVARQVQMAREVISRKREEFGLFSYSVESKTVLVVDDGIASGFSVIAGTEWLRKRGANKIFIGVPTAPMSSLSRIEPLVDGIICLNIRTKYPFAVAGAYQHWYDVPSSEVKDIIHRLEIRES